MQVAFIKKVGQMQRQWVIDQYNKRVADFPWNHDSDLKIFPVLHGTSSEVAKGIASNGFASLASLDEGWFGRGMYFTTNGKYTIPYIITKTTPTIILCYVLMGNVYPVISTEVRGKRLESGFHSHYVVTNPAGKISTVPLDCDEVVIEQESQILPAYIIEIEKGKDFFDLTGKWLRDLRKKTYIDGGGDKEAPVDSVQEMSQHEEWAKQSQNFLEHVAAKDLIHREENRRKKELEDAEKKKKALNAFYDAQNKEKTAREALKADSSRFTFEGDEEEESSVLLFNPAFRNKGTMTRPPGVSLGQSRNTWAGEDDAPKSKASKLLGCTEEELKPVPKAAKILGETATVIGLKHQTPLAQSTPAPRPVGGRSRSDFESPPPPLNLFQAATPSNEDGNSPVITPPSSPNEAGVPSLSKANSVGVPLVGRQIPLTRAVTHRGLIAPGAPGVPAGSPAFPDYQSRGELRNMEFNPAGRGVPFPHRGGALSDSQQRGGNQPRGGPLSRFSPAGDLSSSQGRGGPAGDLSSSQGRGGNPAADLGAPQGRGSPLSRFNPAGDLSASQGRGSPFSRFDPAGELSSSQGRGGSNPAGTDTGGFHPSGSPFGDSPQAQPAADNRPVLGHLQSRRDVINSGAADLSSSQSRGGFNPAGDLSSSQVRGGDIGSSPQPRGGAVNSGAADLSASQPRGGFNPVGDLRSSPGDPSSQPPRVSAFNSDLSSSQPRGVLTPNVDSSQARGGRSPTQPRVSGYRGTQDLNSSPPRGGSTPTPTPNTDASATTPYQLVPLAHSQSRGGLRPSGVRQFPPAVVVPSTTKPNPNQPAFMMSSPATLPSNNRSSGHRPTQPNLSNVQISFDPFAPVSPKDTTFDS